MGNYDVYDVYGTNDVESYNNTKALMALKALHYVVLIYTEAEESTINRARLLRALKVPVIMVRNKVDPPGIQENEIPAIVDHAQKIFGSPKALNSKRGEGVFKELFMVSSKPGSGRNVDQLRNYLDSLTV